MLLFWRCDNTSSDCKAPLIRMTCMTTGIIVLAVPATNIMPNVKPATDSVVKYHYRCIVTVSLAGPAPPRTSGSRSSLLPLVTRSRTTSIASGRLTPTLVAVAAVARWHLCDQFYLTSCADHTIFFGGTGFALFLLMAGLWQDILYLVGTCVVTGLTRIGAG